MALDLLPPDQAADQLHTTPATMQWWRTTGRGPKFVKVGRKVFYRPKDLEDFIVERVPSEAA